MHECGLLEVWPICDKAEVNRSVRVKLGWIGNVVAEVFVQKGVVRLEPELPFVPAMIDGCGSPEVRFAEKILLEDLDGSRIRVGVEINRVVADHPAKIGHHIGRKSVLVR